MILSKIGQFIIYHNHHDFSAIQGQTVKSEAFVETLTSGVNSGYALLLA